MPTYFGENEAFYTQLQPLMAKQDREDQSEGSGVSSAFEGYVAWTRGFVGQL